MAGSFFAGASGAFITGAATRMSQIIQANREADAEREKFKYEADYTQKKSQEDTVFSNDEQFKLGEREFDAAKVRKDALIKGMEQQLIDQGIPRQIAARRAIDADGDAKLLAASAGRYGLQDDGKGGFTVVNQIANSKKQFSGVIESRLATLAEADPGILKSPGYKRWKPLLAASKTAKDFDTTYIGVGKGEKFDYIDKKAYNKRREEQIKASGKSGGGNKILTGSQIQEVKATVYNKYNNLYGSATGGKFTFYNKDGNMTVEPVVGQSTPKQAQALMQRMQADIKAEQVRLSQVKSSMAPIQGTAGRPASSGPAQVTPDVLKSMTQELMQFKDAVAKDKHLYYGLPKADFQRMATQVLFPMMNNLRRYSVTNAQAKSYLEFLQITYKDMKKTVK
jgi:hypothetical protein